LLNKNQDVEFIKTPWSEIKKAMKAQPDYEFPWNDDEMLFLRSVVDFEA
jgi:hypothetical protein